MLNTTIAANKNATWAAELAAGEVPVSAGTTTLNGTALPDGIASASVSGAFTATAKQEPAEQGPCVAFYGGNSTNFYVSASGSFTTPKLGKIVVAGKGTVAGKKATLTINDESVEKAAGTIVLTAQEGQEDRDSGLRQVLRSGRRDRHGEPEAHVRRFLAVEEVEEAGRPRSR